jgi:transposase
MPKSRKPYPPEYRAKIVALASAGRSVHELAAEFEASPQTIRNWIAQAATDRGERPGELTSTERAELSRLRRENRRLQVERDILGKAAAWFARETGVIPNAERSSDS